MRGASLGRGAGRAGIGCSAAPRPGPSPRPAVAVPLSTRSRPSPSLRPGPTRRHSGYSVFTAWPPNSLRSAASTLAPYESSWRERNRVSSDSVMTGAGTSWSIASWTVQRPSPESATQPLRCGEVLAVRPERRGRPARAATSGRPSRASTARRWRRGRARSRWRAGSRSPRRRPASGRTRCRCGPSSRSGRHPARRRGGSRPRAPATGRSARAARPSRPRRRPSGSSRLEAPDAAGDAGVDEADARSGRASAWRRTSSWKLVLPPSTIVSPGSRCSSSSAICASVASPAGTMIQTARGLSSLATSSAIVNDADRALAGDLAWSSRASGCRPRSRARRGRSRRTMLAPIRPRPTNPMRMCGQASGPGVEGGRERPVQGGQPGVRVRPEVDAKDRQVVRLERGEVAGRLGVDQLRRTCTASRGSAGRPGGPRSAGGTSRSGRRPCAAGRSSGGSAGRSRPSWPVRSGREGARGSRRWPRRGPASGAMNAWRRGSRSAGAGPGVAPARPRRRRRATSAGGPRRRGATSPSPLATGAGSGVGSVSPRSPSGEQVAGQLLGLLDVGLVERVDPEDGPGDRGRDLPADELGAEVDRVRQLDPDDRMAGGFERVGQAVARRVGSSVVAAPASAIRTNTRSRPVGLDGAERLEVDRDDPDAVLAGALGDQLLEPGAERRDRGIGQERQLVAPGSRQRADREPERQRRGCRPGPARGRRPSIADAEASSASRSSPISDAGTRPT